MARVEGGDGLACRPDARVDMERGLDAAPCRPGDVYDLVTVRVRVRAKVGVRVRLGLGFGLGPGLGLGLGLG